MHVAGTYDESIDHALKLGCSIYHQRNSESDSKSEPDPPEAHATLTFGTYNPERTVQREWPSMSFMPDALGNVDLESVKDVTSPSPVKQSRKANVVKAACIYMALTRGQLTQSSKIYVFLLSFDYQRHSHDYPRTQRSTITLTITGTQLYQTQRDSTAQFRTLTAFSIYSCCRPHNLKLQDAAFYLEYTSLRRNGRARTCLCDL
ncbi:hypothetical protein DFP73DRAFT_528383 [Morchella snyderi]|nr:hypothetical protein DFP73DRAFT_528383 [Morchella snyderi]